MNELVNEWIQKAEGDFVSASREYRARKFPNYDAAGFHAQQCIEKYLKALLQKHDIGFEKMHNLNSLQELCAAFFPELELYRESLSFLTQFAVVFRYPGESANREQARRAVKIMRELRLLVRRKLDIADG